MHSSAMPWQLETARLECVAAPLLCFARCVSKRCLSVLFDVSEFLNFSVEALQNANSDSFSVKSCL